MGEWINDVMFPIYSKFPPGVQYSSVRPCKASEMEKLLSDLLSLLCPRYMLRKKCAKLVPLGVQHLVTGTVPLKENLCTLFTFKWFTVVTLRVQRCAFKGTALVTRCCAPKGTLQVLHSVSLFWLLRP